MVPRISSLSLNYFGNHRKLWLSSPIYAYHMSSPLDLCYCMFSTPHMCLDFEILSWTIKILLYQDLPPTTGPLLAQGGTAVKRESIRETRFKKEGYNLVSVQVSNYSSSSELTLVLLPNIRVSHYG